MDNFNDLGDERISMILEPKNNVGGLYLGDYTSTETENLTKFKIKAIISAIPYVDVEE